MRHHSCLKYTLLLCSLFLGALQMRGDNVVTYSVNGNITTESYAEGSDINLTAPSENIPTGKVFVGWTTETINGLSQTAPTMVTSATMGDADITYYAVFATEKDVYVKLTKASKLVDGDKIIITSNSGTSTYGMMAYTSGNNCGGTPITVSNNYISNIGNACEITLGKFSINNNTYWTLNDGKNYLYAATDNSYYIKGRTDVPDNGVCHWTLSTSNGVWTISSRIATKHYLRFNPNNTSFTCYTSSEQVNSISIYRKENFKYYCTSVRSIETRSVKTGCYGTICLPYDATVAGAQLYIASLSEDKSSVVLTEATTLKAGQPYIYNATADTQTFTYIPDGNETDAATGGILTGVYENTTIPVGSYVLQNGIFKIVVEDEQPTLSPYRCYLTK